MTKEGNLEECIRQVKGTLKSLTPEVLNSDKIDILHLVRDIFPSELDALYRLISSPEYSSFGYLTRAVRQVYSTLYIPRDSKSGIFEALNSRDLMPSLDNLRNALGRFNTEYRCAGIESVDL